MRLFFGVFPSLPVRDEVARAIERDRKWTPTVRWVGSAKWHVTLQFLGEIDEERAAIAERIGREIAPLHAPFAMSFADFGVFPSPRRPGVLWMGVEDATAICALAESLGTALGADGFALEARKFHPHLTLARIKGRKEADEVRQLLERAPRPTTSSFSVESFVLLESRGGAYHPRAEFPLTRAPMQ